MKLVCLLCLLLFAAAQSDFSFSAESQQAAITCANYTCASTALAAGTCISLVKNVYSLSLCTDPLKPYCSTTLTNGVSTCQAAPTPAVVQAYVGQYCNTTITCAYGTCTNAVCVGKAQGKTCTTHDECDVGLRCAGMLCLPVLRAGESGCTKDEDCELKAGCNLLMGSQKGVCNPYFSVGEGGIATDCTNGLSNLCASGACITIQGRLSKQSYCINAPALNATLPVACTAHSNCTGYSRPWEYAGTCSCGYTATGKAYCSLFPGDLPSVLARTTLAALVSKQTFFACSTSRRFQPDCLKTVDSALYQTYVSQSLYATHYPELQGNDNCVQKIYTNYYWTKDAWLVSLAALLWI